MLTRRSANFKMEKYFQNVFPVQHTNNINTIKNSIVSISNKSNNTTSDNNNKSMIEQPNFEYKGYHKFGRVLGRGRFGTVIECIRLCDNMPIAMKFFKCSGIHKWIPAENAVHSSASNDLLYASKISNESLVSVEHQSSVSSSFSIATTEKLVGALAVLPSEVACLLRASHINGIVKMLEYLPATEASDDLLMVNNGCNNNNEGKTDEDAIIGIVLERNLNEICLFDYLLARRVISESEARFIVKQIVRINLGKNIIYFW